MLRLCINPDFCDKLSIPPKLPALLNCTLSTGAAGVTGGVGGAAGGVYIIPAII
jgi:hypothetical protein